MKKTHKLLILLALVCTLLVCGMMSASAESTEPDYIDNLYYTYVDDNETGYLVLTGVTPEFYSEGSFILPGWTIINDQTRYAQQIGNGVDPLFLNLLSLDDLTVDFSTIQISNNVLIIKEKAFNFVVTDNVIIPSTVRTIEPGAFSGVATTHIGKFTVNEDNPWFYNDDYGAVYYRNIETISSETGAIIIPADELVVVPAGVGLDYKIKDGTTVLRSHSLTTYYSTKSDAEGNTVWGVLTIPKSVKKIEDYASTRDGVISDVFQINYEGTLEEWNNIYIGDNNNRIKNGHIFVNDWEDYTEATCTEPARQIRYCHCTYKLNCPVPKNHWETRVTAPALGHDYSVLVETVPSTCAVQGTKTYKCSRCDETTVEYLPLKTEHDGPFATRNAKTATCITAGKLADTYCTACGTTTQVGATTDPPIGEHTMVPFYDTAYGSATCVSSGNKIMRCKYYNTCKQQTVTKVSSDPNFHPYNAVSLRNIVEPTCCTDGYTGDYYCRACGNNIHTCEATYNYKPDKNCNGCLNYWVVSNKLTQPRILKATGKHTFGDWYTTLEPTCIAEGEERRDCTVGEAFETNALPINSEAHAYEDVWTVSIAPSCIAGEEERFCKLCGKGRQTREIEANGIHVWKDWIVWDSPTCTTPGEKYRFCKNCSTKETEVLPVVAHKYHHVPSYIVSQIDPTCTTPGVAYYECYWYDECKTTEPGELPVVKHVFENYEVITPTTCIKDGLEVAKCQWFDECGKDISQPIPATGEHVWANAPFNTVLSTCTTYGYKEYRCVYHESGCTEINKVSLTALDPDNHAGPINHDLNKKDPTCCSAGYSGDTYCTACDAVMWKGESIPATGEHVWKEVERFDGNCKISGYIKYRCENGTAEHKEDLGVNNSKHYKTEVRNYKAGNCQTMGYSGDEYCTHCNTLIRKGKEIKGSHVGRQKCEICGYNICGCQLCHGTGLQRFIMKMFLWIYKIFGQNKTCACGNVHY